MTLPTSTILIIDNDPPTLELYRRELGLDYRVLICSSEQAALALLKLEDVSAVVLEPVALGERGWSMLTTLRRAFGDHPIPVVVCSTQDERRLGTELGAAVCLVKPVLPVTLRQVLLEVTGSIESSPRRSFYDCADNDYGRGADSDAIGANKA